MEEHPGDGYVRIAGGQMRDWWRPGAARGSVVFVDVAAEGEDTETMQASIRAIPGGAIVNATWLLLRVPDDLRDVSSEDAPHDVGSLAAGTPDLGRLVSGLVERVNELGIEPPNVGVVAFPVGLPPRVTWGAGVEVGPEFTEELLHRCRRSEIKSVVLAQHAISTPSTYHYRLPSGHHSGTFIRTGDIFRDPRAAFTLSTWLRAGLSTTARNVVVLDTGSLAPLAVELDAALRAVGGGRLKLVSLDEYPESQFEYRRALAVARAPEDAPAPQVLCALSVASTGAMGIRIAHTLELTAGHGNWRLEPLITRKVDEATAVPLQHSAGKHDAWLAIDIAGGVESSEDCELCRDPHRARLVSIDPHNFSAKSLPDPDLLMPSITDGRHNKALWDRYQAIQPELMTGYEMLSVSFSGKTRQTESDRQPQDGTYFEPAALILDDLAGIVAERMVALHNLPPFGSGRRFTRLTRHVAETADRIMGVDVVIVDREDIDAIEVALKVRGSDRSAIDLVASGLAALNADGMIPDVLVVDGDPDERAALLMPTALQDDEPDKVRILLFAVGLRLGVTLQRLVVDVHNAWRKAGNTPHVRGLVVHAHPEESRAWLAIRNAFRSGTHADLLALWLTPLPHRSPLEEERLVLTAAEAVASSPSLDARLDDLNRTGSDAIEVRPFWSDGPVSLRRTSYYGDEIGDRVTLAAVGSAMQRARLLNRPEGSPHWYRFDLPKIFRSYFDGLIHVSVLRWLEPREGWWGATLNEQEELVSELKGQAPSDWPLVLPELLLAAAQGKVPPELHRRLMDEAAMADSEAAIPFSTEQLKWVELGRRLLTDDAELLVTTGRTEPARGRRIPVPTSPPRHRKLVREGVRRARRLLE